MYDNDRSKVSKASKVLQDHANLIKDKKALERQVKAADDKLAEMRGALETAVRAAKEAEADRDAVHVVLEEAEWSKAVEVEAAVREAISQKCSPSFWTRSWAWRW